MNVNDKSNKIKLTFRIKEQASNDKGENAKKYKVILSISGDYAIKCIGDVLYFISFYRLLKSKSDAIKKMSTDKKTAFLNKVGSLAIFGYLFWSFFRNYTQNPIVKYTIINNKPVLHFILYTSNPQEVIKNFINSFNAIENNVNVNVNVFDKNKQNLIKLIKMLFSKIQPYSYIPASNNQYNVFSKMNIYYGLYLLTVLKNLKNILINNSKEYVDFEKYSFNDFINELELMITPDYLLSLKDINYAPELDQLQDIEDKLKFNPKALYEAFSNNSWLNNFYQLLQTTKFYIDKNIIQQLQQYYKNEPDFTKLINNIQEHPELLKELYLETKNVILDKNYLENLPIFLHIFDREGNYFEKNKVDYYTNIIGRNSFGSIIVNVSEAIDFANIFSILSSINDFNNIYFYLEQPSFYLKRNNVGINNTEILKILNDIWLRLLSETIKDNDKLKYLRYLFKVLVFCEVLIYIFVFVNFVIFNFYSDISNAFKQKNIPFSDLLKFLKNKQFVFEASENYEKKYKSFIDIDKINIMYLVYVLLQGREGAKKIIPEYVSEDYYKNNFKFNANEKLGFPITLKSFALFLNYLKNNNKFREELESIFDFFKKDYLQRVESVIMQEELNVKNIFKNLIEKNVSESVNTKATEINNKIKQITNNLDDLAAAYIVYHNIKNVKESVLLIDKIRIDLSSETIYVSKGEIYRISETTIADYYYDNSSNETRFSKKTNYASPLDNIPPISSKFTYLPPSEKINRKNYEIDYDKLKNYNKSFTNLTINDFVNFLETVFTSSKIIEFFKKLDDVEIIALFETVLNRVANTYLQKINENLVNYVSLDKIKEFLKNKMKYLLIVLVDLYILDKELKQKIINALVYLGFFKTYSSVKNILTELDSEVEKKVEAQTIEANEFGGLLSSGVFGGARGGENEQTSSSPQPTNQTTPPTQTIQQKTKESVQLKFINYIHNSNIKQLPTNINNLVFTKTVKDIKKIINNIK